MKRVCILAAVAILAAAPVFAWSAEDGAALYSARCSMCHGEKGDVDNGPQMPAVQDTAMDVEKLVAYLTQGDKTKTAHADPIADLNEAQANAIAEHIKALKK